MLSLLNIIHQNQRIQNKTFQNNKHNEDVVNDKKIVSKNFFRILREIKHSIKNNKNKQSQILFDDITKTSMQKMNIGLKNFDVSGGLFTIDELKNYSLRDFASNDNVFLIKFKRKNTEKIMSKQEIDKYICVQNGKIKFKKNVSPDIIYKIAKSLNDEFYFMVNSNDNVVPVSPQEAKMIFAKKKKIKLNSKMHIENIEDYNNCEKQNDDLKTAFHLWFGRNVKYMHPYGYLDMVISKQAKCYKFVKKGTGNRSLVVKTQFSNELADKKISMNHIFNLEKFVNKCRNCFHKSIKTGEEYVFALPFPLYQKHHMLSLVVAIKPNGVINATIINANGYKDAKDAYAIPIGKILQTAFEKYSPDISEKINYFFHENNSQIDETCMTHADCITKQLVKDPDFERDGHDLHPIKIWEKAYMRGFAVTLYKEAIKQKCFIPDDINKLANRKLANKSNLFTQCNSNISNNDVNINKNLRNSYLTSNSKNNNYLYKHDKIKFKNNGNCCFKKNNKMNIKI